MRTVPAIGRLDLTLASLLVVERHGSLLARQPTADEVIDDVLSVAPHLDVPAGCLGDVDAFDDGVQESLHRLVEAGWLGQSSRGEVPRLWAEETAESALAWIRSRLARDHELAEALEALELAVTERVLGEYDDAVLTASPS